MPSDGRNGAARARAGGGDHPESSASTFYDSAVDPFKSSTAFLFPAAASRLHPAFHAEFLFTRLAFEE